MIGQLGQKPRRQHSAIASGIAKRFIMTTAGEVCPDDGRIGFTEDGLLVKTEEGSPQGGPMANPPIVIHRPTPSGGRRVTVRRIRLFSLSLGTASAEVFRQGFYMPSDAAGFTVLRSGEKAPAPGPWPRDGYGAHAFVAHSLAVVKRPGRAALLTAGFVSFDRSQFFPNEITISIASPSRFVLDLSHASRKRSGSLSPSQKTIIRHRYASLHFPKGAIDRTFSEQLDVIARFHPASPSSPLVLFTDEKPSYLRLLARHPLSLPPHVVHHIRIPASLPRTSANPLFPSNYIDRELRKDQANHRRETTCFSRNVANGLTRLICYLVHHNYWKRYLIKARPSDTRTHGTCPGIPPDEQRRGILSLFPQRAFLGREDWLYSPTLRRIWLKQDPTPGKRRPDYLPRFTRA